MEIVTIKNEYARLPFAIVLKYSTALSWDSSMAEKAKPPWIRSLSGYWRGHLYSPEKVVDPQPQGWFPHVG